MNQEIFTALLGQHQYQAVRSILSVMNAVDIASLLSELDNKELAFAFRLIQKEKAAEVFANMNNSMQSYLVGIVTFDDAMDVLVEEDTEDITKMAAMSPSEKPYFETSIWGHAKSRIPWLLILMFSSSITGAIITKYEKAFEAIPLLVSFIPMLMDTGGNCGSQSSTLVIRGIALDEIHFRDVFRVIGKEMGVSTIVGAVLAAANGIRIALVYKNVVLAVVIALSLMATVVMAKMIGCILPLLAKKVKLDPALMASPLITTLVDTCSILIYFMIATRAFEL